MRNAWKDFNKEKPLTNRKCLLWVEYRGKQTVTIVAKYDGLAEIDDTIIGKYEAYRFALYDTTSYSGTIYYVKVKDDNCNIYWVYFDTVLSDIGLPRYNENTPDWSTDYFGTINSIERQPNNKLKCSMMID